MTLTEMQNNVLREFSSYHVMLEGQVQGVGFRAYVEKTARALGISGWVRNRGTKKVEVMFSAEGHAAEAFVQDLEKGPRRSKVTQMTLRRVRTRKFDDFTRKATKAQVVSPDTEIPQNYTFDPSFLAICQKLSDALPAHLKVHNTLSETPSDWGFGQLREAAELHGCTAVQLGNSRPRMHLIVDQSSRAGLVSTRPSMASVLQSTLANDKTLTARALAPLKAHLPKSWQVTELSDAIPHLEDCGALVTKPSRGSTAIGVTTNIRNEGDLAKGFEAARSADPDKRVQLEEHICAVDLRILFVKQDFVAAYLRFPANVIGDGAASVTDLIAAKNQQRAGLPGIGAQNPVPLNALAKQLLNDQGLRPESVPKPGQFVQLGLRPNTSDGADQITISELIHPSIVELCRKAIGILGTDGFWGFDILSEDFTRPLSEARAVICEANNRPFGGVFRHATHGVHHNFFAPAVTALVTPQSRARRSHSKQWTLVGPKSSDELGSYPSFQTASRAYWDHVAQPEWAGRLCLQPGAKPAPLIRKSLSNLPSAHTASTEQSNFDDDLSVQLGSDVSPWKAGLLVQAGEQSQAALETFAPTQFAETLLRPAHSLTLRNVLGSAGCRLMPWEFIPDAEALANTSLPAAGRLVLSSRWRKSYEIVLTRPMVARRLARRLPTDVFPLRLERWQGNETLEAVVIGGEVAASGLRSDAGVHVLDTSTAGLAPNCAAAAAAIPGLNRARIVFRKPALERSNWRLQDVSADLRHSDFGHKATEITAFLADQIKQKGSQAILSPATR